MQMRVSGVTIFSLYPYCLIVNWFHQISDGHDYTEFLFSLWTGSCTKANKMYYLFANTLLRVNTSRSFCDKKLKVCAQYVFIFFNTCIRRRVQYLCVVYFRMCFIIKLLFSYKFRFKLKKNNWPFFLSLLTSDCLETIDNPWKLIHF